MPRMHRDRLKRQPKLRLSFQRKFQLLSAALFNGYLLGFQKGRIFTGGSKAFCVPVLNCYSCPGALGACPIGSLQAAIGGSRGRFPFYVLGVMMLFGVLLGRAICGLLCPFGLIQDLLYKLPVPKFDLPKRLHRALRYVKYLVLLFLVLLLPALLSPDGSSVPYFCKYLCPAGTLEGGVPLLLSSASLRSALGALFGWKLLVLLLILGCCAVIKRFFCKYLCPLGAFYSLFNRFSLVGMHLDNAKCVSCGKCERSCPMNVDVTKNINSTECIRCGKCRSVCPTGALSYTLGPSEKPENHSKSKRKC